MVKGQSASEPTQPRMHQSIAQPLQARRSWWRLLRLIMLILGLALGALSAAIAIFIPQLPDSSVLAHYQPKQPLRVLTADGIEIGGFGSERRIYQAIDQIPLLLRQTLLAVEDARFYNHPGIDGIGVTRAIVADLTGGRMQGASTITQQVARTFFLTKERTAKRKIKEALLALKIERELSKDKILELYMNQIYLGSHAYGFAEAAQTYFGKNLAQLSIAECAMLAGLPQNPHYANPIKNFQRARARQLLVLGRMLTQQVITPAQYELAKTEQLVIRRPQEVDVHAEYVAEMARQQVYEQYGEKAYSAGLRVVTTLRAAEQHAAYQAVRHALIEYERKQPWRGPEDFEPLNEQWLDTDPAISQALADYSDDDDLRIAIVTRVQSDQLTLVLATGEVIAIPGKGLRQAQQSSLKSQLDNKKPLRRGSIVRVLAQKGSWILTQWPQVQGALIALDPHNGEVRALVGGFDFRQNQFNHVTQAWRQPGSSYKPFLYSAALENGVMPQTLVNAGPLPEIEGWTPQNADEKMTGVLPVRQGLAQSNNLVTIRLVQLLGPIAMREWAARFGFEANQQPHNLTLALGSGTATPLQLASAYAIFANGGLRIKPVVIQKITNAKGGIEFEAAKVSLDESQRAIPARNAFILSTMLQEATRNGTAARAQAKLNRSDVYGKTGTTNDSVDAWFAGFQPDLVAVVWIGYDNPQSLGNQASGANLALPVWLDFMAVGLQNRPIRELAPTPGVVSIKGEWRYNEWAEGGFLQTLGLDNQAINRGLIPLPPASGVVTSSSETLSSRRPSETDQRTLGEVFSDPR